MGILHNCGVDSLLSASCLRIEPRPASDSTPSTLTIDIPNHHSYATHVTTTASVTVHHMQPYNPIPTPRFSVPASVNSVNEMMESSLMPPSIRYCPGFRYPTSTTSTYRESQKQDEHLIPKTQQACHHELPSRPGTAV
jgi:hypothetical protein